MILKPLDGIFYRHSSIRKHIVRGKPKRFILPPMH